MSKELVVLVVMFLVCCDARSEARMQHLPGVLLAGGGYNSVVVHGGSSTPSAHERSGWRRMKTGPERDVPGGPDRLHHILSPPAP